MIITTKTLLFVIIKIFIIVIVSIVIATFIAGILYLSKIKLLFTYGQKTWNY